MLICLFTISTVSAEDNSTSDIVSVSNDVNIIESNMNSIVNDTDTFKVSNDELLTDGNNWYVNASKISSGDGKSEASAFKTLKDALNNNQLQDGDTIMIASGEYKGTNNTDLTINKNLNFIKYGSGVAIFDAEGLRRIWTVSVTSINITGLTFKNGKSTINGGAIYFSKQANFNINATFINNTAKSGGAIYIYGGLTGNLTGSFINNTATSNGGAIYISSDGIKGNLNGSFISNTATNEGGAIYITSGGVTGNLNGYFINNTGTYGGAIRIKKGGVSGNLNGYFINNTAKYHSGAIRINDDVSGNLNGSFINNTGTYGGAIYIYGGLTGNLTGSFINNTAKNDGGAIYITNRGVTGNLNGSFINNTGNYGGAIYINGGYVTGNLTGSFINNTAKYNGGAIHIYINGVSGNLIGSFINNTAATDGGAISINGGVSGNLTGSFINNTAEHNGGAIYINGGGVSGNLIGSFINNTATNDGGAIYITSDGITGNLNGSFINNTGNYGGAILINSGGVTGNLNGSFINNTAKYNGGAINMNHGISGNLTGSFINNTAEHNGGAIYCGGVTGNLNGSFINNTATNNGGAIYIYRGIYGNLTGSFINNAATNDGSAIYNDESYDSGIIRDSIFINNNKNTISAKSAYITAINCWFGNNATNYNIKPIVGENTNIENWLFLNATANTTDLNVGETSEITFKLYSYNDTSKQVTPHDASKMNIILDLTQILGELDKTTALIGEKILYAARKIGDASVTGKIENAYHTINLKNNGSEPIPTNITVNTTSLDLTVGDTDTIGANLTPSKAGNLIFTSNDTNIATVDVNGVVTAIAEGTVIITVSFPGNEEYAPAENKTINVTVKLKDASVIVNNDTLNLTVNDTFELIATTNPRGLKVTYSSNNESIATVDANGRVTAKAEGTAIITVSVGGDGTYALNSTNVSATVHEKPIPPKENLTINASAQPITLGDNATVVVNGLKNATGEVTVTIESNKWTGKINKGTANIIVTDLTENVTANVNYAGDDKYNPTSTTIKITVNPNVIIYAPDVTKYYGGSERFAVTLKDLNGKPIANADIKITINGQTYTKTTDNNGETSIGINLNSGVYNVTTEYNGTKVYSTVTVKDTVIAKNVTKIFRNATQYQGTFVDSKGNLVKNTDIRININGVFYTRTTDANGMAQMNINLPPGTYILTAINPSSGEQHTTKVTVLPNIVENYDLTKYYKNASQYSLRLLDDKGNPVGAGVSIQLNINGVFYTRTSDTNGYVKMNINLPPGTYIVTAEYKGLKVSNTINVLTVLETEDLIMKYHDGSQFKAKVLDGQGKPYASQTVTYNINGVFYTKISGDDGIAGLTINLPAGEYIITSMYNGLNVANKVTIIG